MASKVTAELWNTANNSRMYELASASDHRWQEVLNDAGSWGLSLPITDPAVSSATYGRTIRFLVDGEYAFSGQIEQRDLTSTAMGEEASQVVELSGRGLLSRWEDAIVFPKGGLDQRPASDVRPVNWCFPENPFYLSWPYVHVLYPQISKQIGIDPPLHEPWFPPKGWPAPSDCCWVWSSNRGNYTPPGKCLFIYVWEAPSECELVIYMAADNHATLVVDGITVMETDAYPSFAFEDCYRTVIPVSAGPHAIGIIAEVYENSPNGLYRGMVACSGHVLPRDGSPLSATSSVFITDETWQCLDYPSTVPGKTAGGIIYELLLEAAARGAMSGWSTSFDNVTDSAGDPWPWMYEEVLQIGQDYLSVIRQLCDTYCDVTVDPVNLRLNAFVRGGSAPSTGTFTRGTNITELSHVEKA